MRLTSPVFDHEGKIPRKYTCQGEDVNPPLIILEVPKRVVSLALIMDDPDVPSSVRLDREWVHWVIYNMDPGVQEIAEASTPPGVQGQNTGGANAYMGPCPPDREHRYFFKLYALDKMLSYGPGATKEEVLEAIKGHIVSETELMGRYVKT